MHLLCGLDHLHGLTVLTYAAGAVGACCNIFVRAGAPAQHGHTGLKGLSSICPLRTPLPLSFYHFLYRLLAPAYCNAAVLACQMSMQAHLGVKCRYRDLAFQLACAVLQAGQEMLQLRLKFVRRCNSRLEVSGALLMTCSFLQNTSCVRHSAQTQGTSLYTVPATQCMLCRRSWGWKGHHTIRPTWLWQVSRPTRLC